MTKNASILGREAYVGFYVGECPMFQKYWRWANQMTPLKKITMDTPHHQLIEA
jgi:hypothetical protein